jgi:thioredoxin-related protein
MTVAAADACRAESDAASAATAAKPRSAFRHATVEQAWKTSAAAKRPMVLMFTADGCQHCDRMLAETFAHPAIQRMLLEYSETALAHDAQYHALVKRLGIRAFPTTLIVSGQGQIVDAIEGYLPPQEFAARVSPSIMPRTAVAAPAATVHDK